MNFIIKSVEEKLYYNDDMKDDVLKYLSTPSGISKGCLSIEASIDNILIICEHLLFRFVRSGGVFLAPDKKNKGYSGLNVVGNYMNDDDDGTDIKYQNPTNKTRGWCYLLSGTLHRFFYKDWDMYRTECKLIEGDFHWWLQDKEGNIIDLTEEQYILNGIHNCRDGGKKKGPLGLSYGVKTRNIASIILKELCNEPFDIDEIRVTGYITQ